MIAAEPLIQGIRMPMVNMPSNGPAGRKKMQDKIAEILRVEGNDLDMMTAYGHELPFETAPTLKASWRMDPSFSTKNTRQTQIVPNTATVPRMM